MTPPTRRGALLAMVVLIALVGLSCSTTTPDRSPGSRRTSRPAAPDVDDLVRLNQVQVIGSHNSYHQMAPPKEAALRRQFVGSDEDHFEYRHAPLEVQLQSQKIRQIELDAYLDSAGGLYATPLLRVATNGGPYDPAMKRPGIKVFHLQDTDYHSSCLSFKICLGQIKRWSDAHPAHLPVAVLIELKDGVQVSGAIKFVTPEPWTASAMGSLDAEIRSVFPSTSIITPDDVRGTRRTLEAAVLDNGWPTLRQSRGKVLFLMDNPGPKRTLYLRGHPNLAGRVLFTNSNPGHPDAAFVERNDAERSRADIGSLVRRGYVVRTLADHDTREARANDPTTRDAALRSGAQWVSTDYPVPKYGVGFVTTYSVQLPGATVARCNPVNGPSRCISTRLDAVFSAPSPSPPSTAPP